MNVCFQEHKQNTAGELENLHIKIGSIQDNETAQTVTLHQNNLYLNSSSALINFGIYNDKLEN